MRGFTKRYEFLSKGSREFIDTKRFSCWGKGDDNRAGSLELQHWNNYVS